MRSLALIPVLLPVLLLAACGKGSNEPGPGGVTVSEKRALDDAAQMLEQRRPAPAATPTPAPSAQPSDSPAP